MKRALNAEADGMVRLKWEASWCIISSRLRTAEKIGPSILSRLMTDSSYPAFQVPILFGRKTAWGGYIWIYEIRTGSLCE